MLDIDPVDQQVNDARLLRGKQLVPECREFGKRRADLLFADSAVMLACCFPGPHDDLWRLDEYAHLINDGGLDFCGGYAADGACLGAPFDHAGRDVIAVESLAAARVCRREREAIGTEQQALERRHAIPATSIRC